MRGVDGRPSTLSSAVGDYEPQMVPPIVRVGEH